MSLTNPRIGSPNLLHALLCQTYLAAEIWPCLASQRVALLRRGQMILDGVAQSSGFAVRLVLSGLTSVANALRDCIREESDCCSHQVPVN